MSSLLIYTSILHMTEQYVKVILIDFGSQINHHQWYISFTLSHNSLISNQIHPNTFVFEIITHNESLTHQSFYHTVSNVNDHMIHIVHCFSIKDSLSYLHSLFILLSFDHQSIGYASNLKVNDMNQ